MINLSLYFCLFFVLFFVQSFDLSLVGFYLSYLTVNILLLMLLSSSLLMLMLLFLLFFFCVFQLRAVISIRVILPAKGKQKQPDGFSGFAGVQPQIHAGRSISICKRRSVGHTFGEQPLCHLAVFLIRIVLGVFTQKRKQKIKPCGVCFQFYGRQICHFSHLPFQ